MNHENTPVQIIENEGKEEEKEEFNAPSNDENISVQPPREKSRYIASDVRLNNLKSFFESAAEIRRPPPQKKSFFNEWLPHLVAFGITAACFGVGYYYGSKLIIKYPNQLKPVDEMNLTD